MAHPHLSTELARFTARIHRTKNRLISIPAEVQRRVGLRPQPENHIVLVSVRRRGLGRWTHHYCKLTYDNELASLHVWHVGDGLPGGSEYVLTLQGIKRREGADSPNTALYAVVHAQLRQPRETRLLGQLVRSDADPHDLVVYKGETFRIGHALYRVNWISQDEASLAAGALRHPDAATQSLKFDYP